MIAIDRITRAAVAGLLGTMLPAQPVRAHADPEGDVHPQVIARPGVFEVVFYSNLNSVPSEQQHWFRMLYKPDGTLIAPRHRIVDEASLEIARQSLARRRDPERDAPFLHLVGDREPGSWTPKKGTYLAFRTRKDGAAQDEALALDVSLCTDVTAQLVTDDWAVLLWNSAVAPDPADGRTSLKLTWFKRDSKEKPITCELGPCSTVYHFAQASSLVWAGGRVWVAWDAARVETGSVTLSSFDPVTGKVQSKAIPDSWSRGAPSLATTDGWLCVAWFTGVTIDGDRNRHLAKVFTAFEKVPPLGR